MYIYIYIWEYIHKYICIHIQLKVFVSRLIKNIDLQIYVKYLQSMQNIAKYDYKGGSKKDMQTVKLKMIT
jgi:hypothetical protein